MFAGMPDMNERDPQWRNRFPKRPTSQVSRAIEGWSEAECLAQLVAPRRRRSFVEYEAWEQLGYLRGYITKPPSEID
ncbi:MAG: hypothetical protein ACYDEU_08780 [Vulcanimicrobiaceae bacterium]